jgi:uncharacterized membrane protein
VLNRTKLELGLLASAFNIQQSLDLISILVKSVCSFVLMIESLTADSYSSASLSQYLYSSQSFCLLCSVIKAVIVIVIVIVVVIIMIKVEKEWALEQTSMVAVNNFSFTYYYKQKSNKINICRTKTFLCFLFT